MRMSLRYLVVWACSIVLAACYEDKGNYDYSEIEQLEITIPQGITAMAYAEDISFSPTVVSSMIGELKSGDENYEFGCKLNYRHLNEETREYESWVDINPEKTKDVNFRADFPAGNYTIWYSVTNKKTGTTTNVKGTVSIRSSTSDGWMVLGNCGAERKARLDVISKDSRGESVVAYNVLGDKAPDIFDGTQIVMNPSKFFNGELIYLLSQSGGYRLNVGNLTVSKENDMKFTDFILPTTPGNPVSMVIVNAGGMTGPTSRLCVTDIGNAYALRNSSAGSSFEMPLNTDRGGTDPTYQVSPLVGTSFARPGNSSCVLLYDTTNKRFVGWNFYAEDNNVCFPLVNPEAGNMKFSYQTGMDIVDMVSTRFSDGLVYTVLEDAHKQRHVYGINLSGSNFAQESLYSDITAEHFNDATDYAFHSQFPFMFYSHNNKVWSYNLGTGSVNDVLSLPDGEEVTLLKFNLFMNMNLNDLVDHSDEFLAKQFNLIVASTTGEENGGKVRFYHIDISGKMTLLEEYSGFGNVADVTYRERR